jgi:prepilin-type processing-associated H-X9-DG protein
LIELLVVISIIVLLMAILLPALQRVKKQAKAVACQSNLRQCGLMFSMYTHDNNGKFFESFWTRGDWRPLSPIRPYNDSDDIFLCPMATKLRKGLEIKYADNVHLIIGDTFSASSFVVLGEGIWYSSYGLNGWVEDHTRRERVDGDPAGWHWTNFWRTCYVKGAGNIPVYLDSPSIGYPHIYSYDAPPEYEDMPPYSYHMHFCIDRHDGGINSLFMDWSVRKVGLKELWTLKWHRNFDTANVWTRAGGVQPEDWPKWMRNFKDY